MEAQRAPSVWLQSAQHGAVPWTSGVCSRQVLVP